MSTSQDSYIKETAITDNNSAPVYDSVTNNIVVAALYKFTRFADFEQYREPILNTMLDHDVKGTLLLASEGINGTISGTRQGIDTVLDYLRSIEAIGTFTFKESYTDAQPFYRTKVKLKKEIVTMGVENIDPLESVGRYVKPSEWNALISDPEVTLIDTRNDYEVQIGTLLADQAFTFTDWTAEMKAKASICISNDETMIASLELAKTRIKIMIDKGMDNDANMLQGLIDLADKRIAEIKSGEEPALAPDDNAKYYAEVVVDLSLIHI